uniref:PH domain-containing protein n=1 Tax=Coccolithus braarudii TaxID=221442 RepID=A0A7S0LF29_9EUKA|mmetsp:Transcript_33927/g.72441  ORF Transcript_33927/g.72441 Transcript_33927/m.72441 type:complete len:259 (+) Transcript_33927:90-866(+)
MASVVMVDPLAENVHRPSAVGSTSSKEELRTSQIEWINEMVPSSDSDPLSSDLASPARDSSSSLERIFVMRPGNMLYHPMLGRMLQGGKLCLYETEHANKSRDPTALSQVLYVVRADERRYELELKLEGSERRSYTIRFFSRRSYAMWTSMLGDLHRGEVDVSLREETAKPLSTLKRVVSFGRRHPPRRADIPVLLDTASATTSQPEIAHAATTDAPAPMELVAPAASAPTPRLSASSLGASVVRTLSFNISLRKVGE